jgi:hypothetical protein
MSGTQMMSGSDDSPFLSLKWRLLLVLSLVLVSVNLGFAFLVYQKTSAQFLSEQAQQRTTQAREFGVLLEQGIESTAAFANFVPRLSSLTGDEPVLGEAGRIEAALRQHGLMLDVEWGLEGVHYFAADQSGAALVSWPHDRVSPPVGGLIERARASEAPQGAIHCADRCVQLVVQPLLYRGVTEGYLLLERSLADTLRAFHLASGADLAILHRRGVSIPDALEAWSVSVPALTHPGQTMPLLGQLASQVSLAEVQGGPRRFAHGADWYEAHVLSLADGGDALLALGINRVTEQVEGIRSALTESVILGVSGLFVSELVVLLLLLGPVHRIQDVVDVLPLFQEKAFGVLRDALPSVPENRLLRDERRGWSVSSVMSRRRWSASSMPIRLPRSRCGRVSAACAWPSRWPGWRPGTGCRWTAPLR